MSIAGSQKGEEAAGLGRLTIGLLCTQKILAPSLPQLLLADTRTEYDKLGYLFLTISPCLGFGLTIQLAKTQLSFEV